MCAMGVVAGGRVTFMAADSKWKLLMGTRVKTKKNIMRYNNKTDVVMENDRFSLGFIRFRIVFFEHV